MVCRKGMCRWKAYSEKGYEYAAAELYSSAEVCSSAFLFLHFLLWKSSWLQYQQLPSKPLALDFIAGHGRAWILSLLNRPRLRDAGASQCCAPGSFLSGLKLLSVPEFTAWEALYSPFFLPPLLACTPLLCITQQGS